MQKLALLLAAAALVAFSPGSLLAGEVVAGPAYSHFGLTLEPGERTEAVGPFYYSDRTEDQTRWAFPPLLSYTRDTAVDSEEFDFAYPLLTYDRFGEEYRFQIFQIFNFAGGQTQTATNKHRFSLFPFYLQQRSKDTGENYTSFLPFYGHLRNRFFRDEVDFVMMPLWVRTRKRDVVTQNYLYPVFHVRHGDGLSGWQAWPLVGHETKVPTSPTNHWGDIVPSPGHENWFVFWPFFINSRSGIGSTNPTHQQLSIPLYSFTRSPNRDSTSIPFVLGWTHTVDREKKYRETGTPWPIVVFRRGETANTTRVWPFFSHATNEFLESSWYMWPVYKYNRVHSDPLDRDRMRILFFLYSDTIERNTETGAARRRRDSWPLFIRRQEWDGSERLQVLALLEPLLPNSKSIDRDYSQVWSLWRSERNAKTGSRSQSLLWNLYRRDSTTEASHTSLLFGLIQRSQRAGAAQWRLFWWPKKSEAAKPASAPPAEPAR